jgi:hypothetical protein
MLTEDGYKDCGYGIFRKLVKVVYNTSIGGFSISLEALTRMQELGYEGESSIYNKCAHLHGCARHNPILVQVVEELGKEANGPGSDLCIEQVFGRYRIENYDGAETVIEPEDYEWITP